METTATVERSSAPPIEETRARLARMWSDRTGITTPAATVSAGRLSHRSCGVDSNSNRNVSLSNNHRSVGVGDRPSRLQLEKFSKIERLFAKRTKAWQEDKEIKPPTVFQSRMDTDADFDANSAAADNGDQQVQLVKDLEPEMQVEVPVDQEAAVNEQPLVEEKEDEDRETEDQISGSDFLQTPADDTSFVDRDNVKQHQTFPMFPMMEMTPDDSETVPEHPISGLIETPTFSLTASAAGGEEESGDFIYQQQDVSTDTARAVFGSLVYDEISAAEEEYEGQDQEQGETDEDLELMTLKMKHAELQRFQRQVSAQLRSFYTICYDDRKMLAKFCQEIVHAHQHLLISAEKQLLIQQDIQNLQHRRSSAGGNSILMILQQQQREENHPLVEGCYALRTVTLKLRNAAHCGPFFREQNECFLLVVIVHRNKVMNTCVMNIDETKHGQQVVIDVNEVFWGLEPSFEITVKFFAMFHPNVKRSNGGGWKKPLARMMSSIVSSFSSWNIGGGGSQRSLGAHRSFGTITGNGQVLPQSPVPETTRGRWSGDTKYPKKLKHKKRTEVKQYQQLPVIDSELTSNFSLVGAIKVNVLNAHWEMIKFDQFNYCCVFEDEVRFDSELTLNYLKRYCFHFEFGNDNDKTDDGANWGPGVVVDDYLIPFDDPYDSVKRMTSLMERCYVAALRSVLVRQEHIELVYSSKMEATLLDLRRCLNIDLDPLLNEIFLKQKRGICFVFLEQGRRPEIAGIRGLSAFNNLRIIMVTGAPNLADLYRETMLRVTIQRQWNPEAPVPFEPRLMERLSRALISILTSKS